MTVAIWLAVFISDALLEYVGGRYIDARRDSWPSVVAMWAGVFAVIAGVNVIGFTTAGWWALVPSVAGSMVGAFVSVPRKTRTT